MPMVKVMAITVDSLLSRPKLDCDWGYDVAVKGLNVVGAGLPSAAMDLGLNQKHEKIENKS